MTCALDRGEQSTPRSSRFNPSEEPRRPLNIRRSGRKKFILSLPGFVPRTFHSAACKEATTHIATDAKTRSMVRGTATAATTPSAWKLQISILTSQFPFLLPPGQGAAPSPCAKQGQNCSLSGMTSALCSAGLKVHDSAILQPPAQTLNRLVFRVYEPSFQTVAGFYEGREWPRATSPCTYGHHRHKR